MRRNSEKLFGDVISTVTVAVLFFVILMLVVFSAISYQRSVEISDANGNTRAVLSYIITAVKASEASRVSIEDMDGMQVLVIEDVSTGYAQEIFHKDGKVQENYGRIGEPVNVEDALVIGEADVFEFDMAAYNLLQVTTDLGSSYVHLHAAQ